VFDFNLDVNDGEFIVLVGPSGCGKSTTLRMIAGLEEVTSGTINIDKRDVTQQAAKNRDIAMVFQNYALYAHMTVYENMAFSLMMRKENASSIHEKVMSAAEILGLTDQLGKKPKQLSGGQRQRVAVGRAMVRNPKVFLFDEPLSNLDAKLRGSMRRELKLLHRRLGATTIYVTHDQIEALTLADRIVVMNEGRVQQIGRPT
jgi:multiple sugar transport system ATP-binding protein